MLSAVGGALKSLRLDDRHYAVCAAHTDTACPHVHVAVSRVDPETGRAVNLDAGATKRLSRWAEQYEREHGGIVVPTRVERRKAQAARRDIERRCRKGGMPREKARSTAARLRRLAGVPSAPVRPVRSRSQQAPPSAPVRTRPPLPPRVLVKSFVSCRRPRPAFSTASTPRRPSLSSLTSSRTGTSRSSSVSSRPTCCIRRLTRRFWSGRMRVRCSFTQSSRSTSVRSGAANRPFGSMTLSDSLSPTGRSLGYRAMMLSFCFAVAANCRFALTWLGATVTCMRIRSSSRRWAICTSACWPRPLFCLWIWMPACRLIPTIGPGSPAL